jgi:hypothetical protein
VTYAESATSIQGLGSQIVGTYVLTDGPLTCSPNLIIEMKSPNQGQSDAAIFQNNPEGYMTAQIKIQRGQKEKIKTLLLANLERQAVEVSENAITVKRSSVAYNCSDCDELEIKISDSDEGVASEISFSESIRRDDPFKKVFSSFFDRDDSCIYQRQP